MGVLAAERMYASRTERCGEVLNCRFRSESRWLPVEDFNDGAEDSIDRDELDLAIVEHFEESMVCRVTGQA